MVRFDDVPGLRAEVVVDGEPLQEYDDDDAEPDMITKYIEACSDKEFVLKFTFDMGLPMDHGVEVKVDIDGDRCHVAYRPGSLHKPRHKYGMSFLKDGQRFRQNYRFTALNIGNILPQLRGNAIATTGKVEGLEGTVKANAVKKDLESKGSIGLSFRLINNVRDGTREHHGSQSHSLRAIGAVPEKALKGDARSHQATLGKPRLISRARPCALYDYVGTRPFAKVNFKYRSLAALKALRVINHDDDGSVEPLDDVPEDTMTPEQLREALRRARRRENESRRVKQESNAARNIKREHTGTMDRTGDDDEVTIISCKRLRSEPVVIVLD